MTNGDHDVQDSVSTAELELLIADRITPPLSALCDRLSLGDSAWRQRVTLRNALSRSIAEAIRSAVRPMEERIEALEAQLGSPDGTSALVGPVSESGGQNKPKRSSAKAGGS